MTGFKVWIARNKNGSLNFWGGEKPYIIDRNGDFGNSNSLSDYPKKGITQICIPKEMYPDVIYKNSPVEFSLIKVKK